MFNSMQPSRPKLPHHNPSPPTNQAGQIRTSSTLCSPQSQPQTHYRHPKASPHSPFQYTPWAHQSGPQHLFPRNQIEAMPPTSVPFQHPSSTPLPIQRNPLLATQPMVLDASKRHPVFFTEKLKKAPAGVGTGGGVWCSPVAEGYVFNDGERRRGDGDVKL